MFFLLLISSGALAVKNRQRLLRLYSSMSLCVGAFFCRYSVSGLRLAPSADSHQRTPSADSGQRSSVGIGTTAKGRGWGHVLKGKTPARIKLSPPSVFVIYRGFGSRYYNQMLPFCVSAWGWMAGRIWMFMRSMRVCVCVCAVMACATAKSRSLLAPCAYPYAPRLKDVLCLFLGLSFFI